MSEPFRSPSAARETAPQHALIVAEKFDYSQLDPEIARQVQPAVPRIQRLVGKTVLDMIAVGQELLAVKEALPHGSFGPWVRAEFKWAERTARNFMRVAARFGPKTATLADSRMGVGAAYLLAAASAPEEASEEAIRRAARGEWISASVAREILDAFRKEPTPKRNDLAEFAHRKLLGQLIGYLESIRRQCDEEQIPKLAEELREYADSLEQRKRKA